MPISNTVVDRVQDTAIWVAMARALESERKDALFRDPFARKLAGPRGEAILKNLSRRASDTWPIIARTVLIDEYVNDAVRSGIDAVLNLAAGLDSRPYRLALPKELTWIEVDHADMIQAKNELLSDSEPKCIVERIALDLSVAEGRRELFTKLSERFPRILIITEGLLLYLPKETALDLAKDLLILRPQRWITDLNNSAVAPFVARRTRNRLQGTAKMQFATDEGPRIFKPAGWRDISTQSIFKTAGRIKRLPFPMSLFAKLPEPKYGDPSRPWTAVSVLQPGVATYEAKAYSAISASSPLAPTIIERREPGPRDVQIEILFCGICHTDVDQSSNDWGDTTYPLVPGHEIVGRVKKVGLGVTEHQIGDLVGVGCLVDSDNSCSECKQGLEQFCKNLVVVFGSVDKHLGGVTHGGFSESIVVHERFVFRIPTSLDPAAAAPLLCGGITVYSPLRHWGIAKGRKVGIVGLGGLGHLGVKFAHAMEAEVVVFTTSPKKADDARRLGADDVILAGDETAKNKHLGSFDLILDTVSGDHDINALLAMLKRDGNLSLVGAPVKPLAVSAIGLIVGRKSLSGSNIGGVPETQHMLNFCGERNITADVEVIPIQQINEAYKRILKSDVLYRFVIDMASIRR